MKYFSIILLLALVVVLAVSVWPTKENGGVNPSVDGQGATLDSSPTGSDPTQGEEISPLALQANECYLQLMGSLNPEYGENYTFVDSSFSLQKEGALVYTVIDATVTTNINDLPEGTTLNTTIDLQDGTEAHFYKHPYSPEEDGEEYLGDFVLEDGSFIPDVYMVLLTVRIESQDAACYIYHEKEGVGGHSYDPYLFWMSSFIRLYDIGEERRGYGGNHFLMDYYSGYNTTPIPDDLADKAVSESELEGILSVYRLSLRLEPGEVQEVTFGYMIERQDGHLPNPADLCAVTWIYGKNLDGNWYVYNKEEKNNYGVFQALYLGLSWPEGMEVTE